MFDNKTSIEHGELKRAMEIFGESGIEIKITGQRHINDFTSII